MLTSSSVRILAGFLSPSSSSTFTSSSPAFTSGRRLQTSSRKSKTPCRCSLRFQERPASEANSRLTNNRSEDEISSNRTPSLTPPATPQSQRAISDEEDEVSGVEVPRQKYIPIPKSQLLDAIVLVLLEGEGAGKVDDGGGVEEFLRLSSCLDSILHAEHKRILEEMRVDYALTHSGGPVGSGEGRESDGEVRMGLDYGLEELRKLLLGSSGKKLKPDSGVDSRCVEFDLCTLSNGWMHLLV
uniref:Uncharacterized protein n=1 Tax=Kalanchoe fedtschenkoi TaxID=63787 RepID=A0A7N0T2F6_KALFE